MKSIRYFIISTFFVACGIAYSREMPKLKAWLLSRLITLSREQGIEVSAEGFDFTVLPPGVEIYKVQLRPQKSDLSRVLTDTTIDKVTLNLDPAAVFAGRFEIEHLLIDHPSASIFIRNQKTESTATPPKKNKKSDELFNQIINIPVHAISVQKAEINAKLEPAQLLLQLKDFGFNLTKNYQAAKCDFFAPEVALKRDAGASSPIMHLGMGTRIILEKNAVEVSALKINQGDNYIIARGVGRGEPFNLEFRLLNGRTIAHINLAEAKALANLLLPNLKLPDTHGELNVEVNAEQSRGKDLKLRAQVDTKAIQINQIKVGQVKTEVSIVGDTLQTPSVSVFNDAGRFSIQDLLVHLKQGYNFSSHINLEEVELRQFLDNIGIKNVPLHMDIAGEVPCEGTISPEPRMTCAGTLGGKNFRVFTDPGDKTVVALKSFSVEARMEVDRQKVSFPEGILQVGESKGEVIGSVDYQKGFNFSYHSDRLNFSDIQSLADLKYDGGIQITGLTSGDGHQGIISAHINTDDFWFENYGLGAVDMGFHYEKGYLTFSDINAQKDLMTYKGNMLVKLDTDSRGPEGIEKGHLLIDHLELADLQEVFIRKVKLPFQAVGTGSGELDVSGPFALSKLNYKLKSTVHRPSIGGETFSEFVYNVHGINGHAYADDVHLAKSDGMMKLTGDVEPSGDMHVVVGGQNLRLADFERVRNISQGLDGKLKFDMSLNDFILSPHVDLKGSLTQTTLNQQAIEDSSFEIMTTSQAFKIMGDLFSQKVKIGLTYPWSENAPFAFQFAATDWDFSSLLSIFGKNSLKRDYDTSLTAKVDLSSPSGNLWKSTGSAVFDKFYVRRGTSQMKNVNPIIFKFDDGHISVSQLSIDGDNTHISATGNKNKKDNINFNINGKLDMSLLMFLTPFLRDMSGELSISTQVGGTVNHPELLGSAYIKKGYFKLDALPEAFEDINLDATFSQSRILINRMGGRLGGGSLSASGTIGFKDFQDIPLDMTGELLQTTTTVPEGLQTKGDLHFGLSGNWFPYLLKGDYTVSNGVFSKNLGDDETESQIKRSSYLPTVILKKDFIPLEVDISTHFQKGITIKNALMESDVKGDIEVKGDPSRPILKGDVEAMPNGKIFFRDTPFNIVDARMKFNNPTENNPTIYAQATTRVRDWDINLLVQGTKQKWKLELGSTPPLPEKSIVSLLALGLTDEDEVRPTAQSTIPTVNSFNQNTQSVQGYSAGSVLLDQNPATEELKKRFGVKVHLTQTVDETQNIIMPKVVAEKEWTPRISTTVGRTLGDLVTSDANVQYKLDRHFSVIGSFENREYDPLSGSTGLSTGTALTPGVTSTNTNILGIDLQYQLEFK